MTMTRRSLTRLPINIIQEVAEDAGVPFALLAAIVATESAGDQYAIRFEAQYKYLYKVKENAAENDITAITEEVLQKCSFGLAQVMGGVARELNHKGSLLELLDPHVNLHIACALIKRLIVKNPNRNDMIAAYNAGSAIKSLDGRYKNQDYVDKVNGNLALIGEAFKISVGG